MNRSIKKVQGATRVGAALIILSLCFVQNADAARVVDTTKQVAAVAFSGGTFYTGASQAGGAEKAVARYTINPADPLGLIEQGLAPNAGVNLNGAAGAASPLHNKQISALTTMPNGNIVAAVKVPGGAGDQSKNTITLITQPTDGLVAFSNATDLIKDTANNELADQLIPALAASNDTIFVALPQSGGNFSEEDSGFARLKVEANELRTQQHDGAFGPNKYYKLDKTPHDSAGDYIEANDKVQILSWAGAGAGGKTAEFSSPVMHWDEKLQRLYVGLSDVKASGNQGAGIASLLVGRLDGNELKIKPAVDLKGIGLAVNPFFTPNNIGHVVGFNAADASGKQANIYNIGVMHTSTNKDLVIINGGVEAVANIDSLKSKVYALPVVSGDPADAQTGFMAQKNANAIVDGENQLYDVTNAAQAVPTSVGGSYKYLSLDGQSPIDGLCVAGESVYVSLNEDRTTAAPAHTKESGVFKSTALFAENGNVRSWTPWQRVTTALKENGADTANDAKASYGARFAAIDEQQGRLWYLTNKGDAGLTPRVALTNWGAGDKNVHNDVVNGSLSVALNNAGFKSVSVAASFDEETAGFKAPVALGNYGVISVMALADNSEKKLGLVQTGGIDNSVNTNAAGGSTEVANVFAPRLDFTGSVVDLSDKNYVDGAATIFEKLGSINAIELARSTAAHKGWLFVGGENGIAVMRKSGPGGDAGKGFNSDLAAGLENLNPAAGAFPGNGAADQFKFAQIVSYLTNAGEVDVTDELKTVRKVVSDGTYIYALTPSKLIRIAMGIESFKQGKIQKTNAAGGTVGHEYYQVLADLNEFTPKTQAGVAIGDISAASDEFFDLLLLDKTAAPAADAGAGPAGAAKKIALATTRGLFVNEANMRGEGVAAADGKKWQAVSDEFSTVLKMDFVNSVRGGRFGPGNNKDGNLYVTALDANKENVCVYRLDVQGGAAPKLVDNTAATGSTYLYKLGTIDEALRGDLTFDMPADLVGTNDMYKPGGELLESVQLEPTAAQYAAAIAAKTPVDFGNVFYTNPLPISGVPVQDSASGAVYIPGEFGLLVRE